MIIELFFIFTLLSGLIKEILAILKRHTNIWIESIYALGSLFFLFWKEPYILHGGVIGLLVLSIFHGIAKKENDKVANTIRKMDPYLSLICLVTMFIHYWVYFRQ